MLKYNTYFLFERNIAFFFNYVTQLTFKLQSEDKLKLDTGHYYRTIYLLCKN